MRLVFSTRAETYQRRSASTKPVIPSLIGVTAIQDPPLGLTGSLLFHLSPAHVVFQ